MRLREKFPGKTRSRGLKGKVCAVSLNSTSSEDSIILRITLSEDLLSEMGLALGMRVDMDIADGVDPIEMLIYGVEEGGWKILASGVTGDHKHGMIVPVLAVSTAPVKSERAEIKSIADYRVRIVVPLKVAEALQL